MASWEVEVAKRVARAAACDRCAGKGNLESTTQKGEVVEINTRDRNAERHVDGIHRSGALRHNGSERAENRAVCEKGPRFQAFNRGSHCVVASRTPATRVPRLSTLPGIHLAFPMR